MPKLPSISPQKLAKALEKAGFVLDRTTGSHSVIIIQLPIKKQLYLSIARISPKEP